MVIFTKKASSPIEYVALTRDLCMSNTLTPSTKAMVLKINLGSFEVTGVKRSFSLCLRPSTYVLGSNVNLGSIGVTGVKRSFSLKMP